MNTVTDSIHISTGPIGPILATETTLGVRGQDCATAGHHPGCKGHWDVLGWTWTHGCQSRSGARGYVLPFCAHCGAGPLSASAHLRDGVACVDCLCSPAEAPVSLEAGRSALLEGSTCPICLRAPDDPHIRRVAGLIAEGCIHACHTGHLSGDVLTWHERVEADRIRMGLR